MSGPPAVHATGAGPALVFLHAFPLDASQWDHQVASVSGAHQCLRYDLWGCGDSPPPPDGAGDLDAFAGAVLADLGERGIERFTVVGMSLGGYIAFALLRARPEAINSLVLCSTRATADSDAVRSDRLSVAERALSENSVEFLVEANVQRLVGSAARAEPHITDPLRARVRRCTPAGIAYALRAMAARPDSTALLAGIAMPTLVITGAEDLVITPDEQRTMAGAISGARHVEMPCGHLPNLELPQEFTEVLEDFLVASR